MSIASAISHKLKTFSDGAKSRKRLTRKSRALASPAAIFTDGLPYPCKIMLGPAAESAGGVRGRAVFRHMLCRATASKTAGTTLESLRKSHSGTIIVHNGASIDERQHFRPSPRRQKSSDTASHMNGRRSDPGDHGNNKISQADLAALESMMQGAIERRAAIEGSLDGISIVLNVGGIKLPKGARLMWTGAHPALGAWDPYKGVEVRVRGTSGEAQAQLPVGSHEWKLVVVDKSSEMMWEQGENRFMHIPEAALKLKNLITLEVTCKLSDTKAIALKTKVYKARLTAELMNATQHVKRLKERQESLSERMAQIEQHMNERDERVQREAASVVSLRVRKLSESLRMLKAKHSHHSAVEELQATTEEAEDTARHASSVLDDANRLGSAVGGNVHRDADQPVVESTADAGAMGKASSSTRAHRSFKDAFQSMIKAAAVLATELHPRLRGGVAAEKDRDVDEVDSPVQGWVEAEAHMTPPHAVGPSASGTRAAAADVMDAHVGASDSVAEPSASRMSGRLHGVTAGVSTGESGGARAGERIARRTELATASRHGLFPALCLLWAATQPSKLLASIREAFGKAERFTP